MYLETERLKLLPLNGSQLRLITSDVPEFEKNIGYRYDGEAMEGVIHYIFKKQIEAVEASEPNHLCNTFWMLALKDEPVIIGSMCFKNPPTEEGSVELGYGINMNYGSRGYMTEAIGALINWGFQQPEVRKIVAQIDKDNIASRKVVEKNGLHKFKTVDDFEWFIIERK